MSYRVGTALAGAIADQCLGISLLQHRMAIFGRSAGARGDLVGRDRGAMWHGVEAKGHGPDHEDGSYAAVGSRAYASAKRQAASLGADLHSKYPHSTATDHWAMTTLSSVSGAVIVVTDDPPPADGDPPTDAPRSDLPGAGIEQLLQAYYQVVGDIEEAIRAAGGVSPPRAVAASGSFRGTALSDPPVWVGAHERLFEARREQALATTIDELRFELRTDDENAFVNSTGLALAVHEGRVLRARRRL